jgi:hypothetical protein
MSKCRYDFGHEMRVGGALRNHIANVEHGARILIRLPQKAPANSDYRCSLRREAKCLSLAVECKNHSALQYFDHLRHGEGPRAKHFTILSSHELGSVTRIMPIVAGASSITRSPGKPRTWPFTPLSVRRKVV